MANRKRKADEDGDGDETMSPGSSPATSSRVLARPSKKARPTQVSGRSLTLPRLLETLDTDQLRSVLERICDRHPDIGHEVATGAPKPTPQAVLDVLHDYQNKLTAALPYGQNNASYVYDRIRDHLIALVEAIAEFTPQFLPPTETQPLKSLQFLDGATEIIHEIPNLDSEAHMYHKETAYDDITKAWTLVISEAGKRAGGFNLYSGGWDDILARHNHKSGGRLASAINAMSSSAVWMGGNGESSSSDQNSIRNQLMNGSFFSPVRVGPW